MGEECCLLVGGIEFNPKYGCIISISMNSRTEVVKECGDVALLGPTTGSVNLTAYVREMEIYAGCQASANVSIPWVRKYACEGDVVYYIQSGKGSASIIGQDYVDPYAKLLSDTGRRYYNISANVGQGPTSIYAIQEQVDGSGLDYYGGPIDFNTGQGSVVQQWEDIMPVNFLKPEGATPLYLQSFNLNLNPGEIPQVSYSFAFGITGGGSNAITSALYTPGTDSFFTTGEPLVGTLNTGSGASTGRDYSYGSLLRQALLGRR